MSWRVLIIGLVAIVAIVTVGNDGHAQPAKSPADEAFERGRSLMEEQKYFEACAAFSESLALDYQIGTLYNLAECHELIGKLASAWKAYKKIAAEDTNQVRRTSAQKLVDSLEPRLPHVVVAVQNLKSTTRVTLDDEALALDVLRTRIPVDIGTHRVVATTPDMPEQAQTFTIERPAQLVEITLTIAEPRIDKPTIERRQQPPPRNTRALVGKITVAVSGAALVTGAVFGYLAFREWDGAQMDYARARSDEAIAAANDRVARSRTYGTVSTVLVAGGAVGAGVGVVLWATGGGVAVNGEF